MGEAIVAVLLAGVCLAGAWVYEYLTGDHSLRGVIVSLGLAGLLFLVYMTGAFDSTLYRVGLNHEPCARNLLSGVVLCGDELDQVRDRRRELLRELRR